MVFYESVASRRLLVGHLLWFLLWTGVTVVGTRLSASPHLHGTHQQLGLPPCPSVLLSHRPCPGCGLTTSFTATLHADWPIAFAAHPFGPVLYALFTASAFACLVGFVRQQRFNTDSRALGIFLIVLTTSFLLYGGYRMLTTTTLPFAN